MGAKSVLVIISLKSTVLGLMGVFLFKLYTVTLYYVLDKYINTFKIILKTKKIYILD